MGPNLKIVLTIVGIILAAVVLASLMHAQTSRPVTDQVTCTGTAPPGSLFAFIAIAPGTGTTPVALQPFRCLAMDPNVFQINAAGQLTIKTPAPIAGTTCDPPLTGSMVGAIVYAQAADKSCLPIVAVADPSILPVLTGDVQYLKVFIPGGGSAWIGSVAPTPVQPPQ